MRGLLLARMCRASAGAFAFSAGTAFVAAGVLDRSDPRAAFLVGVLLGLGAGLAGAALLAIAARRRARAS